MSGIQAITSDLAQEYRITRVDANEIIRFINVDIVNRVARGEVVHLDQLGSFHSEDGKIWFNPSEYMKKQIREYRGPKARKEKKRGDRWKQLHQEYLQKLDRQKKELS